MSIFQNKTTRALILVMCALVLLGISIAKTYYGRLNQSIDPRIVEARTLYDKYNVYAQQSQIDSVFILLDSMEAIYKAIPHYESSFELGVINNNRSASYLTLALYSPIYQADSLAQDSIIQIAEDYSYVSIDLYKKWIEEYESLSEADIRAKINSHFIVGLEDLDSDEKERVLDRRVDEILEAQVETKRRLSVAYTNLGIIFRHREQYQEAADAYTTALELWDQNLTAENNLNILLGKPLKKRTFIQKLFPPKK